MKELRLKYSIRDLSTMLSVSGSGYYEWMKRRPSKRQQEERVLEVAIKAAHNKSRGSHGPAKLQRGTWRKKG